MKKILLIVSILVVLTILIFCVKIFLIGEPANTDSLAIQVEERENQLTIYLQSMDSATAISNIQYRYNGTVLKLIPWKVLCSSIHHDGNECIYYEITDETEIWVDTRLIWSRE